MRPLLIVDANPIVSALIGGFSREVFFQHNFDFMTTPFTLQEVEKYLPYICEKAGIPLPIIRSLLQLLPLVVCEPAGTYLAEAKKLIRDEKDIPILALAMEKNAPLWSNDKHFEEISQIHLVKTKDFA